MGASPEKSRSGFTWADELTLSAISVALNSGSAHAAQAAFHQPLGPVPLGLVSLWRSSMKAFVVSIIVALAAIAAVANSAQTSTEKTVQAGISRLAAAEAAALK